MPYIDIEGNEIPYWEIILEAAHRWTIEPIQSRITRGWIKLLESLPRVKAKTRAIEEFHTKVGILRKEKFDLEMKLLKMETGIEIRFEEMHIVYRYPEDRKNPINFLYSRLMEVFDDMMCLDDPIPIRAITREQYIVNEAWMISINGRGHIGGMEILEREYKL